MSVIAFVAFPADSGQSKTTSKRHLVQETFLLFPSLQSRISSQKSCNDPLDQLSVTLVRSDSSSLDV